VRIGQHGLDRLLGFGQPDAIGGAEGLIQRAVPVELLAQPGEPAGRQVGGVDGHRLAVGQPEPVDAQRAAPRADTEQQGEVLIGRDVADLQDFRLRVQAVRPHAFGVAGQLQGLSHLGLGHERALALPPQQASLDHQLGQRLADGGPRRTVIAGQLAFRRDRAAWRHRDDELEQLALHRVVLGQPQQRAGQHLARPVLAGPAHAGWGRDRPGRHAPPAAGHAALIRRVRGYGDGGDGHGHFLPAEAVIRT